MGKDKRQILNLSSSPLTPPSPTRGEGKPLQVLEIERPDPVTQVSRNREIEEVFNLRRDSAVSRVCQRTQANHDSTPELRRRMEKLGNLND